MGFIRFLHRYLVRQTMPAVATTYYDKLIDAISDFYLQPLCEEIIKFLPGTARILDIGTGTGQLPVRLAMINKNFNITGIDLSGVCLDLAVRHSSQAGISDRVRFERLNIENHEWNVEPFDLVISTCSLHHWRHPSNVLMAAKKLLKPKGKIWLMDDAAEASGEKRKNWINLVQKAWGNRMLFRTVYSFESRFLAYSRDELTGLANSAGLCLADWKLLESPFFIVKFKSASNDEF